MQDDPNTEESDVAPIETEAWEIAFKPYEADAEAAFDMARRLMEVKRYLDAKPPNLSSAAQALDEAAELLFPFTQFYDAAYDLYLTFIHGHPTRAQEDLMESLGIRY
jgi:hypothetical protein